MKRLPYLLQIMNGIAIRIGCAIEVEADRRTVRFRPEQVVEPQIELLREMANRCMPLIDEFAAVFRNLSLIEVTASGPTTPPKPVFAS